MYATKEDGIRMHGKLKKLFGSGEQIRNDRRQLGRNTINLLKHMTGGIFNYNDPNAHTKRQVGNTYSLTPKKKYGWNTLFGGAKPKSARGAIVAKVMKERGLSLGQASKFVKEHGLY